jgi:hypothetical protein
MTGGGFVIAGESCQVSGRPGSLESRQAGWAEGVFVSCAIDYLGNGSRDLRRESLSAVLYRFRKRTIVVVVVVEWRRNTTACLG